MNFKDIDFSKVAHILDSMSDEEKENLGKMAQDMMNQNQAEPAEEEEDVDFFEFLHIQEDDYTDLPGTVLDEIEAAVDMEVYYEEDMDADFSAVILFYAKAMLNMLRKYHYPIYRDVLGMNQNVATTTLYSYLAPLMQEENIQKLGNSHLWIAHRECLQTLTILLSRAEYDTVNYQEVQMMKETLFNKKALLNVKEVI